MRRTGAEVEDLLALSTAYARAVDRRDGAAIAELFTRSGVLVTLVDPDRPKSFAGAELAAVVEELTGFDRTEHEVGEHAFAVAGDTATGVVRCAAHHVQGAQDHVLHVRYDDRYLRRDGRWLFENREVRVLSSERRSVGPA